MVIVEAASLNAEGLTNYIVDTLKKHQLDLACITSQGYDGASVMSGHCSGVQEGLGHLHHTLSIFIVMHMFATI